MKKTLPPYPLYIALEGSTAFLFSMVFTVSMVYQVLVVGLSPFQLVLMGTILEVSVFIFEVPTGILADVKSRRLSIIIGYILIGCGFILEGALPFFWSVALAQVIWGLGFTFISGATQAWITDEIGEPQAGPAFLRGAQAARIGELIAIPLSILLGNRLISLPIVISGGVMIFLALFLSITMGEDGFKPKPAAERTTWQLMFKTVVDARQVVHRQPLLLTLLAIGLFYGLYSEGFDRLWTPHFLQNFNLPGLDVMGAVVWFGLIRGILKILSLLAIEGAKRRLDLGQLQSLSRVLQGITVFMVLALLGFALLSNVWLVLILYLLFGTLRSVTHPLYMAWFNKKIDDPQVRATMFSVSSLVDAVGQIGGGPSVGLIGNISIRAALTVSAVLLGPVVFLYGRAKKGLTIDD